MGTVIGFLVGYVMGTRAGPEGYQELRNAWGAITSSEETREVLAGLFGMVRDLVSSGTSAVVERSGELRRVA